MTAIVTSGAMRARSACGAALGAALLAASASPVAADTMQIERVVSPGGIEAWLVQHRDVPLVTMQFAFRGGSVQDPDGKEGLANFLSETLDEGAGELDASAFQERQEELGMRLNFEAHRDVFAGRVQTLTQHRDESFELLRLALREPRFDADAVERVRGRILAQRKFNMNDPQHVAAEEWYKLAFPDHPYGRPTSGTFDSVGAVTADDLRDLAARMFARDNLKIAAVGDIGPDELGKILDQVFGDLPAASGLPEIAEADPPLGPRRRTVEMNVPQSVVLFGHRGPKRDDEDFIASYVLNYVIGGGGFSSRLMEEVRDRRGLAYSVYSYLQPMQRGAVYLGNVATENKAVARSLGVIEGELRRMAEQGPTPEELEHAQQHLTGSYALRFDTSTGIASQLLWIQIEGLGIDYVDKRNDLVEAVTLEDVRRVANDLLRPDSLIVTIVGGPDTDPDTAG